MCNNNTFNFLLLIIVVIGFSSCVSFANGLNIRTTPLSSASSKLKDVAPIIVNNNSTTDLFYQDYYFQGGECKMASLIKLELQPLYKASESCIKVGPDNYQKAYCNEREFVVDRDCDETCKYCSGKSSSNIFSCAKIGIGMMHRVCGKLPLETIPKMLWQVQHEDSTDNENCSKNKIVKAIGEVVELCEWNLYGPRYRSCNSTDYSVETFTGSIDKCETRIKVSHGKVGVCNGNEEYQCK
ncbi:predicted protein [Naegleria gruberi]|uniref:Predicted protein n=1 Tax=Naegleria gruberi TaxID=5762 RepID=D2VR34_NAEGR|nr:uncharacterized protein NAEGRDRAFT_71444 [Naegleria gruberi]EFC40823.1 predicted protein [Naegleria gruberi]|eukprot:XP_002673567.1 predicted protein [Naegleria gruberi strain NEG-M]